MTSARHGQPEASVEVGESGMGERGESLVEVAKTAWTVVKQDVRTMV